MNGKRLLAICLFCTALGNIVPRANAFINLGNGVFKSNGSHDDTQAAANAAPVGGTVLLPSGTFTWTHTVFVDKSLNIFGASVSSPTTILNNHPNPTPFHEKGIIYMVSSAGVNPQIKNIHFGVGPNISGPYMGMCQLWFNRGSSGGILLLHDCTFDTNGTIAKGLRLYQNGAVIWNCTFNSTNSSYVNGIGIQNNLDTYPAPSTMGVLDKTGVANCYVEDSKFNNMSPGYSLDIDDSARFVVRHCAFTNSYIGSHGQETSPLGMRHAEVYNCTFSVTSSDNAHTQTAIAMRGGTWVIFNNTFGPIPEKPTITMQVLAVREGISYITGIHVCPTHYPIPRQVGQGWKGVGGYSYPDLPQDGGGYTTDPVYIWSNTPSVPSVAVGTEPTDSCGHGLLMAEFIKAGRDYFIGTPKPGYVPYLYPHPLRATAK